MEHGKVTSHELVQQYLIRIALYDHVLKSVINVNPHALEDADARDRERKAGHVRGPLHGIPIALKDNIQTTNMPTTGGALAFKYLTPPYEATLTKNLEDAGAIIIAKTTLSELANWVAGNPDPMPANYNGVNGQSFNPYDPRMDPRPATFDGRAALSTGGSKLGRGDDGEFLGGERGERHGRIGDQSVEFEYVGGDAADDWEDQSVWSDTDHGGSRYGGSDGADGDGHGDSAGGAGESHARSAR